MKVSLNWVRYINDQYHCAAEPAPKGIDSLVEKIGLQLGAVEEVIDLGKKYQGIVIAKVVSCVKHPNADKLSVCLVDDAKAVKNVKRDKDGLVEIACGAPNVKSGMLAAWIPPGNTVPSTVDKEPFILESREIRGVVSNGMLASAKELDLGDDHSGIVELEAGAKIGADFAKTYGLDDHIIDIENKMFTHRPDCFGMLGIAREIAGIQGHKFKSPDWYRENTAIEKSRARNNHKVSIKNDVAKLVPRFSVAVIKDVAVSESPINTKARLAAVGVRPINNIVDMTNFYMLETAQPLHAYDYDKVLALQKDQKNGVKMGVRLSKKGESLKLLGGKMQILEAGAVLITADDAPIGMGGVMGGADTEVDENTKNIILECANFDMNLTRRTAMRYGLFTDAATRFTKGQSSRQNMAVLAKAVENILMPKYSGGRVSYVIDDKTVSRPATPVVLTVQFINDRLGEQLGLPAVKNLLENVEFVVSVRGEKLSVTPPFWRTDIEIPEDIVEEVGRLYGYSRLPQKLPMKDLTPAPLNQEIELKSRVRELLSAAGANEALTYSFVHGKLLERVGQDKNQAYKLANALSPDLQFYRLSLTPSLLEKVHPNIKAGYDFFGLYELGKAHSKSETGKDGLPKEFERLSVVLAGSDKKVANNYGGAAFYWAKKYASYLFEKIGIEVEFRPLDRASIIKPDLAQQMIAPYEPERSAAILVEGELNGVVGEYKWATANALKLPKYCAGFELNLSALSPTSVPLYRSVERFPSLDQDITLKVPSGISYAVATDLIYAYLEKASPQKGYIGSVQPLDIYQAKNDKKHRQITWRITLQHPERTLTSFEANKLLDELSAETKAKLGAERI